MIAPWPKIKVIKMAVCLLFYECASLAADVNNQQLSTEIDLFSPPAVVIICYV